MANRPAQQPSTTRTHGPGFDLKEIERLHGPRGAQIVSLRFGTPQHSLAEIGERVGLTKQGVSVALKRITEGRQTRRGRRRIADDKVERIFDLICLGTHASVVAEDVGVSITTVTNYIRKAPERGVQLRSVVLHGEYERAGTWRFPVPRSQHSEAASIIGIKRWPRRSPAHYDIEPDTARSLLSLLGEKGGEAPIKWSVTIQRVA